MIDLPDFIVFLRGFSRRSVAALSPLAGFSPQAKNFFCRRIEKKSVTRARLNKIQPFR